MSWTTISDSEIEEGKPVTSILLTSIRDNILSITKGTPGTPKVLNAAHLPPISGATYTVCRLIGATAITKTNALSYPVNSLRASGADPMNIAVTALVSGVITATFEFSRDNAGIGYARLLKNGAVMQEWTTTSDTYSSHTLDIAVTVGDCVALQGRISNTDQHIRIRNYSITSDNENFAVA